jgi:hypothetical protein
MRKRKIKPGSFEDRATVKAELKGGQIDLKALWDAEVDKELDPTLVKELAPE